MTQEEKELLLKDLCARQSYGVKVLYKGQVKEIQYIESLYNEVKLLDPSINYTVPISDLKPYLRPLSSLTSEDKAELNAITEEFGDNWLEATTPEERWKCCFLNSSNEIDWLISHHIDYRGLIPMGLALEALEGMYEY